jgi:hypothetical protein
LPADVVAAHRIDSLPLDAVRPAIAAIREELSTITSDGPFSSAHEAATLDE